jgi:hypothetical protein
MTRTETVFAFHSPHATHLDTPTTRKLNQKRGDPCNGRSSVILPEDAPHPPMSQLMQCPICLAELEMALVSETPVTIG